jgi:hypothetical protein
MLQLTGTFSVNCGGTELPVRGYVHRFFLTLITFARRGGWLLIEYMRGVSVLLLVTSISAAPLLFFTFLRQVGLFGSVSYLSFFIVLLLFTVMGLAQRSPSPFRAFKGPSLSSPRLEEE